MIVGVVWGSDSGSGVGIVTVVESVFNVHMQADGCGQMVLMGVVRGY